MSPLYLHTTRLDDCVELYPARCHPGTLAGATWYTTRRQRAVRQTPMVHHELALMYYSGCPTGSRIGELETANATVLPDARRACPCILESIAGAANVQL